MFVENKTLIWQFFFGQSVILLEFSRERELNMTSVLSLSSLLLPPSIPLSLPAVAAPPSLGSCREDDETLGNTQREGRRERGGSQVGRRRERDSKHRGEGRDGKDMSNKTERKRRKKLRDTVRNRM